MGLKQTFYLPFKAADCEDEQKVTLFLEKSNGFVVFIHN